MHALPEVFGSAALFRDELPRVVLRQRLLRVLEQPSLALNTSPEGAASMRTGSGQERAERQPRQSLRFIESQRRNPLF